MIEVDETNWSPIFQPKPIGNLTSEELAGLQQEFCNHLKPLGVVKADPQRYWFDGEHLRNPGDQRGQALLLPGPVFFERVIERRGTMNLLQCAAAYRRWFAWVDNSEIEWVNPLPPPKPIEPPAGEPAEAEQEVVAV